MNHFPNNFTQLHAVVYMYLYVALYGDKKKSLDEIDAIKNRIKDWDTSGYEKVYKETKEWFEADKASGNRKSSYESCIEYLNENLDRFRKAGIIQDLVAIANADGQFSEGEDRLIAGIAEQLEVHYVPIQSDTEPGHDQKKENDFNKQQQKEITNGYEVVIISYLNKLGLVKLLHDLLNIELKAAKELVDTYPVTIARGIDKESAEKFKNLLEEIGCEIYIGSSSSDNLDNGQSVLCNLIYKGTNGDKIEMVELIKDLSGLSLTDSKAIVDNPPAYLTKNTLIIAAKPIFYKIKNLGGVVEVEKI